MRTTGMLGLLLLLWPFFPRLLALRGERLLMPSEVKAPAHSSGSGGRSVAVHLLHAALPARLRHLLARHLYVPARVPRPSVYILPARNAAAAASAVLLRVRSRTHQHARVSPLSKPLRRRARAR